MNDRCLSWVGGVGALFAVASVVFFGLAMGFDPGAGSDLVDRLVATAPGDAPFVRWGAVADMLGYYLAPLVLVVAVRSRLHWPSSISGDLATVAGIAYGTIGAMGAVMLAAAAPPLIEDGSQDAVLMLETLGNMVQGLWQWLNPLPFALWATGVALALRRSGSGFAALFAVLALGGVLVWIGRLLDLESVLIAGLVLWLGPFPLAIAATAWWSRPRGGQGRV